MKRLVLPGNLDVGQEVALSSQQAHYLFAVLRLTAGDQLVVVDEGGNQFAALLLARSRRGCRIVFRLPPAEVEPGLKATLCVPLLKGDKLELVIQKAVELGVGAMNLYSARRSVVRPGGNWEKKLARWQAIARAATQQCGRTRVPAITGFYSLAQLVPPPGATAVYAWEQAAGPSLKKCWDQTPPAGQVVLLTGPEGGLEPREAEELDTLGFQAVTLGPRVMRAETAAIAMLACTMYAAGQLE